MFNIGDQVIRKNKTLVGTITKIDGNGNARVKWPRSWQRFNGNWQDTFTWCSPNMLLLATAENLAAVAEKVKPTVITRSMQRTLEAWIAKLGREEYFYTYELFKDLSGRAATVHRNNLEHLIRLGYLTADRTDVGTAKRKYRIANMIETVA